jgi:DNA polymerase-3 subunit delta
MLLLARAVMDERGNREDVARRVGIQPWLAGRYMEQARRFSLPDLDTIYHRLLDLDVHMKTGQVEPGLGIEMLISTLSQPRSERR